MNNVRRCLLAAAFAAGFMTFAWAGNASGALSAVVFVTQEEDTDSRKDYLFDSFVGAIGERVSVRVVSLEMPENGLGEVLQQKISQAATDIVAQDPVAVVLEGGQVYRHVAPLLRERGISVVFCGLWLSEADQRQISANETGILEAPRAQELLLLLKTYTNGSRVGLLAADAGHERAMADQLARRVGFRWLRQYYVRTFEEWKRQYEALQKEVDIVIAEDATAVQGWDTAAAQHFALKAAQVPSGSTCEDMRHVVLFTVAKSRKEQGVWAAHAVETILDGFDPQSIPVAENRLTLFTTNHAMAMSLSVPVDAMIEAASARTQ